MNTRSSRSRYKYSNSFRFKIALYRRTTRYQCRMAAIFSIIYTLVLHMYLYMIMNCLALLSQLQNLYKICTKNTIYLTDLKNNKHMPIIMAFQDNIDYFRLLTRIILNPKKCLIYYVYIILILAYISQYIALYAKKFD